MGLRDTATPQECLKFLREIQFGGSHDFSARPFQHSGAISSLYSDATSTFLKVIFLQLGSESPFFPLFKYVGSRISCCAFSL